MKSCWIAVSTMRTTPKRTGPTVPANAPTLTVVCCFVSAIASSSLVPNILIPEPCNFNRYHGRRPDDHEADGSQARRYHRRSPGDRTGLLRPVTLHQLPPVPGGYLPPRGVIFQVDIVDLQPVSLGGVALLTPGSRQADAQDHFDASVEATLHVRDEVPARRSVVPLVQSQVRHRQVRRGHQIVED